MRRDDMDEVMQGAYGALKAFAEERAGADPRDRRLAFARVLGAVEAGLGARARAEAEALLGDGYSLVEITSAYGISYDAGWRRWKEQRPVSQRTNGEMSMAEAERETTNRGLRVPRQRIYRLMARYPDDTWFTKNEPARIVDLDSLIERAFSDLLSR
jgi:hypothetical protein